MAEILVDKLKEILKEGKLYLNEPMKRHTSFKIGGPADVLAVPGSRDELINLIAYLRQEKIPFFILGNGTNLLVSEKGIRGVVVKLSSLRNVIVEGTKIIAEAGASLSYIANVALVHELTGFEFASGIPGTLGGAIVMNAGAYGPEMKDVVEKVEVLDENNNILILSNREMKFSYRYSILQEKEWIVLRAWISLERGNYEEIKKKMEELNQRRKEKQPLDYPSAGSTFKRPPGYYAGKLIEDAGLKGYSIGGAKVSEKHSGFIINTGNATFYDVLNLIEYIQKVVKEKFGVELVPEIKIVGEK
ncbi:UDP-N-acetylenolpyruvoylglucosamine reductase [Caldanaerobacter subterraneus subsp. yonseiensis KB-1]|uniref:UDP-N-acetylenolpyruvoylglucosamine reductase n=1 Tax=Caldanaerobacter subterraneus subsp. yonseiensis KB-1 TaxID=1388761 RepID=U5CW04_CALSX|nr:UDP-N-acetylmuramate dehydrogenase [Caldanaerobacter subterraneus]ERM93151.1 UDP-N-acetylenolpyruvoylglucosamine reductase [Caldanaerobacter subterraneus subsp. yonseiensis KB-1]